ncbi:MAG: hypothetical protein KDI92_07400 [Xanthomonadales bacterium]|nr:hypothetical protein [Xanthomonadales bacterium]
MKILAQTSIWLFLTIFVSLADAQVAFVCTGGPRVVAATASQPAPSLYQMDTTSVPFTFTSISTTNSISYNAIGYRILDDLIYGIEENGVGTVSTNLVQVDATGTPSILGPISGLPINRYISGDFDTNNHFYVSDVENTAIYVVDIDTRAVTNQFTLNTNFRFSDLAYNPQDNQLYAISTVNTLPPEQAGQLIRIDLNSGTLSTIGNTSGNILGVGSLSFDSHGLLLAIDNLSSGVYSINTHTGQTELLSSSPGFSRADSAHCANAVFPIGFSPVAVPTLNFLGSGVLILFLFSLINRFRES